MEVARLAAGTRASGSRESNLRGKRCNAGRTAHAVQSQRHVDWPTLDGRLLDRNHYHDGRDSISAVPRASSYVHDNEECSMPKQRVPITKSSREAVLAEFNHRCAICGTDRPQIHHIDANPANNDLQNLLPLCPNCHLVDSHNPTAPVDPAKLALFRRYKDPAILSPYFHPLFSRFRYLLDLSPDAPLPELHRATEELIAFVSDLNMGDFYHRRLGELLIHDSQGVWVFEETGDPLVVAGKRHVIDYREQLRTNRMKTIELIVEMLRYQDWPARKAV